MIVCITFSGENFNGILNLLYSFCSTLCVWYTTFKGSIENYGKTIAFLYRRQLSLTFAGRKGNTLFGSLQNV